MRTRGWKCPHDHIHRDPRAARSCWKEHLSHREYWNRTRFRDDPVAKVDAAAAIMDGRAKKEQA